MQGKAQLPSKVPSNANVRKQRSEGTVERSIQDDGWRWRHLGFTLKYFIMWVCISWFSTVKCKRKYVSVNSSVEACHFFHFLCWHTWVSADGKKTLFTLNDYAHSLRISHRDKYFWRKRLQNPAGCKSGKNLPRRRRSWRWKAEGKTACEDWDWDWHWVDLRGGRGNIWNRSLLNGSYLFVDI